MPGTPHVFASSGDQVRAWAGAIQPVLAAPGTADTVRVWQPRVRTKMRQLLGLDAFSSAIPEVSKLREWRHEGLKATSLLVAPPGELGWEALVLEPSGSRGKRPGWVCLHGHLMGGMSSMVGLIVDEPGGLESLKLCECDYAFQLARHGYVTMSFHCPGFGSRRDDESGTPSDPTVYTALRMGVPYLGWCVANGLSALSVLQEWLTVDPDRLGAVGFSMGATVAQYMAVDDDRIKATIVSGKFGQANRRLAEGKTGGGFGIVPGMPNQVESADIMSAIAPRHLFVNQEVRFDPDQSRADLAALHRTYDLLDVPDRLVVTYDEPDPPKHRFNGDAVYPWAERVFPTI